MKALFTAIVVIASLGSVVPVYAAGDHGNGTTHMNSVVDGMSQGTVKKVDPTQGKITIKHGPLKNLGMPGMTMVFKAGSTEMLDKVKPGEAVNFIAEDVDGVLTVTRIESTR